MSHKMGKEEASSSSKGKALAYGEKKKMNGKQVETSSSSSSSSEDEDDDDESSDDDQSSSSTSDLDEESIKVINKVEKMIQWLNVKGVPSKFKISFSQIKEMSKEREDAMDAASWGTLWKFVQTSPHPRQKKKVCKNKALTSIRSCDDSSSEEEAQYKRHGHKHSSSRSSRMCLMA